MSNLKRVAIVVVVVVLAALAPELYILLLIGGVDFAWLVLLSFMAPALVNMRAACDYLVLCVAALRTSAARSLLARPAVFATSAAFAFIAFLVSGSVWVSLLYLAPIALSGGSA